MFKYGVPLLAAAALTFAVLTTIQSQPVNAKLAPPSAPPSSVYANQLGAVGLVEAASENIAISVPVSGLVVRVAVKAGDHVRKGAHLFSLDGRDLEAELAVRKSALALAEARLDRLAASPRAEDLPPAIAKVREAEQLHADAVSQLNTLESVRDKRAIRGEDLERHRFAVKIADARLEQARAELARLQAGAWKPDLEIARAEVEQARRQVERVEADLSRLVVTAPIDGEIFQCKVHAGEYAAAGPLPQPLIVMGDTARLNIRADIDEEDAWRLKGASRATGMARGNSSVRVALHLLRVEPYVIPKRNLAGAGVERVDTRVLQAIFSMEPGTQVYPGQQMDVFIDAGDRR